MKANSFGNDCSRKHTEQKYARILTRITRGNPTTVLVL